MENKPAKGDFSKMYREIGRKEETRKRKDQWIDKDGKASAAMEAHVKQYETRVEDELTQDVRHAPVVMATIKADAPLVYEKLNEVKRTFPPTAKKVVIGSSELGDLHIGASASIEYSIAVVELMERVRRGEVPSAFMDVYLNGTEEVKDCETGLEAFWNTDFGVTVEPFKSVIPIDAKARSSAVFSKLLAKYCEGRNLIIGATTNDVKKANELENTKIDIEYHVRRLHSDVVLPAPIHGKIFVEGIPPGIQYDIAFSPYHLHEVCSNTHQLKKYLKDKFRYVDKLLTLTSRGDHNSVESLYMVQRMVKAGENFPLMSLRRPDGKEFVQYEILIEEFAKLGYNAVPFCPSDLYHGGSRSVDQSYEVLLITKRKKVKSEEIIKPPRQYMYLTPGEINAAVPLELSGIHNNLKQCFVGELESWAASKNSNLYELDFEFISKDYCQVRSSRLERAEAEITVWRFSGSSAQELIGTWNGAGYVTPRAVAWRGWALVSRTKRGELFDYYKVYNDDGTLGGVEAHAAMSIHGLGCGISNLVGREKSSAITTCIDIRTGLIRITGTTSLEKLTFQQNKFVSVVHECPLVDRRIPTPSAFFLDKELAGRFAATWPHHVNNLPGDVHVHSRLYQYRHAMVLSHALKPDHFLTSGVEEMLKQLANHQIMAKRKRGLERGGNGSVPFGKMG
jgi:hypothetical protein